MVFICFILSYVSYAQTENTVPSLKEVPLKYLDVVSSKAEKYSNRIASKTEKTLAKLSKWENKIKELLQKTDPATADRLFGEGKITFTTLLQKVKAGETIADNYKAQYDSYTDKITTGVKYIETKKDSLEAKYIKPVAAAKANLEQLDKDVAESEAVTNMIKARKKQLIEASLKTIGKSKYLMKLNKETYYYTECLKNYKEAFSSTEKTEALALKILDRIPGFAKFKQQNSQLAGIFAPTESFSGFTGTASIPIVSGIPSRSSFQEYLQTANPVLSNINLTQHLQADISPFKSELDKIKNKAGSGGMDNDGLPDFKPNNQKTKPFIKRLEYGTTIQFAKSNPDIPSTIDLGLSLGYKLNDKNSAGIGMSYLLGTGKGWNHISLSNEGVGFITYVKSKIKKGFAIQGGSEWNYKVRFNKLSQLKNSTGWQQSALMGINKSISSGKKVKANIQLLYNFLHNKYLPVSPPFVFRYGYNF